MSGRRYYPEGVKAALHVMSGGGCYRPECGEPSIRFVDGAPEINVEIAHIHAFEKNGPREIKTMTPAQRNHISNLILLCIPCHKRVDADEVTYPALLLKRWKSDREAQPLGGLGSLRGLDATTMQELLDSAMAEIRKDMTAFAEGFPELAQLLRETIAGLPSLDPESLHLLNSAAARLDLPEYAPMVHVAAARLDLPDYAPMVHDSARSMELPDYAPMLVDAARKLDLVNQVPQLDRLADSLAETVATMSATLARAEAVTRATLVPRGDRIGVFRARRRGASHSPGILEGSRDWVVRVALSGPADLSPCQGPILTPGQVLTKLV